METLLRGLLSMYETAIRLIEKHGRTIHELNKTCKERSNAVGAATMYEYEKARQALHEAVEKRQEVEADRAAVAENMREAAEKARQEAVDLLEKQIETDPKKVDGIVAELLRNDMYSDKELRKEAERFKDNPTMLRLIGKYAARRPAADMQSLAAEIERKHGSRIIETFDELVKVCAAAVKRACAWRDDGMTADDQVKALDDAADPVIDKAVGLFADWSQCQK